MTCDLTDKTFTDETAARAHFEKMRWPDGPICPHCGTIDEATELHGESTRPGLYKCRACQKPFTAIMGTLYERSHIPLHKWLLATHLMTASKKGIRAHQLWRMLGFSSYRTAWFMAHRIREGMRELFPEDARLSAKARRSRLMKRSSAALRKISTATSASTPELAALERKPSFH
jgi:transposase-like protein